MRGLRQELRGEKISVEASKVRVRECEAEIQLRHMFI